MKNLKTEIIAVASGKGGTGKTLFTACMGFALIKSGLNVLMIDGDPGTDGLSLFLLGPKGREQLQNFDQKNTFAGAISLFKDGKMSNLEPRSIYRNQYDGDHNIEYEVLLSGKGIYGDLSRINYNIPHLTQEEFQEAIKSLLNEIRSRNLYDYVLIDTRGGFTFESTDICALVDSFIIVTEADLTSFYQDRSLVRRIALTASQNKNKPLLRAVVVNKTAYGNEEESFRDKLTKEFPIKYQDTFAIPLDPEVLLAYREQKIPYLAIPSSPFCYATISTLSGIFNVTTSRWEKETVKTWNELVMFISEAIKKRNKEEDKKGDFIQIKKKHRKYFGLTFAVLIALSVMVSILYITTKSTLTKYNNIYDASIAPAIRLNALIGQHQKGENNFDFVSIPGADLTGLDLSRISMRYANLEQTKLINTNLQSADLSSTNLKGADLKGANLQAAKFRNSNLNYAILTGTEGLTVEQLSEVKTMYQAKLPPDLEKKMKNKNPDQRLLTRPQDVEDLINAADSGNLRTVRALIEEKGVEKDSQDNIGQTALYAAAGAGNVEIVKYLIEEQNADPNLSINNTYQNGKYSGWTPLKFATYSVENRTNISIDKSKEYREIINLLRKAEGKMIK